VGVDAGALDVGVAVPASLVPRFDCGAEPGVTPPSGKTVGALALTAGAVVLTVTGSVGRAVGKTDVTC
jgi:hypothetical protein